MTSAQRRCKFWPVVSGRDPRNTLHARVRPGSPPGGAGRTTCVRVCDRQEYVVGRQRS